MTTNFPALARTARYDRCPETAGNYILKSQFPCIYSLYCATI